MSAGTRWLLGILLALVTLRLHASAVDYDMREDPWDAGPYFYELAQHVAAGHGLTTDVIPPPGASPMLGVWPWLVGTVGAWIGVDVAAVVVPAFTSLLALVALFLAVRAIDSRPLFPTAAPGLGPAHVAVVIVGLHRDFFARGDMPYPEPLLVAMAAVTLWIPLRVARRATWAGLATAALLAPATAWAVTNTLTVPALPVGLADLTVARFTAAWSFDPEASLGAAFHGAELALWFALPTAAWGTLRAPRQRWPRLATLWLGVGLPHLFAYVDASPGDDWGLTRRLTLWSAPAIVAALVWLLRRPRTGLRIVAVVLLCGATFRGATKAAELNAVYTKAIRKARRGRDRDLAEFLELHNPTARRVHVAMDRPYRIAARTERVRYQAIDPVATSRADLDALSLDTAFVIVPADYRRSGRWPKAEVEHLGRTWHVADRKARRAILRRRVTAILREDAEPDAAHDDDDDDDAEKEDKE